MHAHRIHQTHGTARDHKRRSMAAAPKALRFLARRRLIDLVEERVLARSTCEERKTVLAGEIVVRGQWSRDA